MYESKKESEHRVSLSFFLSLIKHPENHLNNMKQKYGIFAVMKLIFSLFLL